MLNTGVTWFVALPDTERCKDVARMMRGSFGDISLTYHPSGRPWLMGQWNPKEFAVGHSSSNAIAVIGEHRMTNSSMCEYAAKIESADRLDVLYSEMRGSMHLIASVGGTVKVLGTASGLRRVYHCLVDGVSLASSHASVLARLAGATIDPTWLATRLLFDTAPWPLEWHPVWNRVEAVAPSHYLQLTARGVAKEGQWWHPPTPRLSYAEGAEALRAALTDAVQVRVKPGETVVSHLSGLDSSTLCSLAARAQAKVIAITAGQPDPMDDDVAWARRTVAALRESGHQLVHDIIEPEECPLVYDRIMSASNVSDDPFLLLHNWSRFKYIIDRGQAHHPRIHLAGLGGDEMLTAPIQFVSSLMRRKPLHGLRLLRIAAARNRWEYLEAARSLYSGKTYSSWLVLAATLLDRKCTAKQ